jgi:hypothetical protein
MTLARSQREFLARALATGAHGACDPGLAVYRRTLGANRHMALAAAYPVVARLVGEAFFAEAAERFASSHPSRAGDLHEYGGELADFLASYPHAASLHYLADVARLEWAVHRCGFAADPQPFDAAALAAVPVDRRGEVRFRAQAGTALVASRHPIVAIWEANQAGRDGVPTRSWEAEVAVVYRRGLEVRVARAGAEAGLVARLLAGDPLAAACRDEADAAALPRWVEAGIFTGIVP